ncbi:hypothetical protein RCS94_06785 [Orbaceae bacterium ac157xtp]
MIAPSSYGALSATSANTIQGSRPGFTGQSGAKKLGFKIDNITYSESEGNLSPLSSGVINYFNAGLSLNEFDVMSLTASDFSPTSDYADTDGDLAHLTTPFSMSPRTFVWKDRNGTTITNYNQTLGCGSNLNLPLTLRITLPNVKVRSRYGNPSESIPTPLVQEYKIGTATGICFAKPNSLFWKPGYGTSGNSTNGGGYSSDFDPDWGFKASASPKFPTTGFVGASFTLIMTSNASDYTFSSNKSAVVVDTTGKVTLKRKPSGAVTIKAVYKNDTNQVHYYTFNPMSVWVVPKSSTLMNYASAKQSCRVESKIASRAQLTNSPQINHSGSGTSIPSNSFTRAVGGGVFGEWGWITGGSSGNYPGSQWDSSWNCYWTRDVHSSGNQFTVLSDNGTVSYVYTSYGCYVACLG